MVAITSGKCNSQIHPSCTACLFVFGLLFGMALHGTAQPNDLVFYVVDGHLRYLDFNRPDSQSSVWLGMDNEENVRGVYGTNTALYALTVGKRDSNRISTATIRYLDSATLSEGRDQPVLTCQSGAGYIRPYRFKCTFLIWLTREGAEKDTYAVLRGSRVLDTVVLNKPRYDRVLLRDVPGMRDDSAALDRIIDSADHRMSDPSCESDEVVKLPDYYLGIYHDGVLRQRMLLNLTTDIVLDEGDTIAQMTREPSNVSSGKFAVRVDIYVVNSRSALLNRSYAYMLLCDVHGNVLRKIVLPDHLRTQDGVAFVSW